MKTGNSKKPFKEILTEYHSQRKWLMSLITDPTGSRYHVDKSDMQRMQEFEEQMARTGDFLEYIGNPESKFKSIHVAGTSGKGSVVSMIAAILSASKINNGFHISPYLQISNEKLIVNDQMIPPSAFIALIEEFKEKYIEYGEAKRKFNTLKYGEAWVILTYLWLANEGVDWGVIETGLGGRYDPTNVLPANLAVLTNIDFDHVKSLGPTIEKIAWHKAGIIKEGKLAVTSEIKPEIVDIFKREAAEKNAMIYCLEEDFTFEVHQQDSNGAILSVEGPYEHYPNVKLAMKGNFQPINAALAIASLDILKHHYQMPISPQTVQEGLEKLVFPGRMEIMQQYPLVMIDGAHNQHKMQALVDSIKTLYKNKKIIVVVGMLSTKDASGMIDALFPITDKWIATQPDVFGKPATSAEEVVTLIQEQDENARIQMRPNIKEAVELAISQAVQDELVLVTGSLYMIGAARNRWFPSEELLSNLEK
ncbi:MAG: hypothetical protein HON98_01835 [Chloroflexi bacterium]|jgi:dihydrofolate synthase / folylpolyglutamate synthase|nr:hypothetical protein [Chloroflexota bacterium]MBT3670828.1 hypothetical protein [Chloroflexota bacterium]MBT4002362.1 hypothetical protein [Chloroflexota bacterium]MBT4305287.1 hypothetical protein [Chloroflexota bacterium]MBT4532433.1 hypothetical protein [Chloroflexota bacterium]